MVRYAKEHAEILPKDFEENQNIFTDSDRALQVRREMIDELEKALA